MGWDDPVFNEVWANRRAETLLSERSAAMLQWRFGAPGRLGWQACAADDRNGNACGYAVWRELNGFVEVGDFAVNEPDSRTAPLIVAFTRFIRGSGARSVSLEFSGPGRIVAQLEAAGLRRRPEEDPVFVGRPFVCGFQSFPDWYLTAFDSDAD